MRASVKRLWVNALRSGDYVQGHGRLRTMSFDPEEGKSVITGYCCLGVLCDIAMKQEGVSQRWENIHIGAAYLPDSVMRWAGLSYWDPAIPYPYDQGLAVLNDRGRTFREIADLIERFMPEEEDDA